MKRVGLVLVLMSMIMAPALCQAGSLPAHHPAEKVDDQELSRNSGQGLHLQTSVSNQERRIVIWDEWARSASAGAGAGNPSYLGVSSVNYGQRQATFTATSR